MSSPKILKTVRTQKPRPFRIVLFVEDGAGDWHAKRLREALQILGAEVSITSLKYCAFDTRLKSGIFIPGFAKDLPDGVFVRSISSGSLEQITLRLGILHALKESGVRVWNEARVIERCVDKSTATFLLQKAGLPVPPTRTAEGIEAARRFLEDQQGTVVLKPLFGSQGNGIRRICSTKELPLGADVGDVFYLQNYLHRPDNTRFEDWRVFISHGRVLAAMARVGQTWITNVHQGGQPISVEADDEMTEMALSAAHAIGADYAGVDLIRDQDNRLLVLEINSNPAWKGLQSVTDINIAWTLAQDFLTAVSEHAKR